MKTLLTRWLPCATLTAWSSVLLYFFFSGRIQAFLHPTFRPYVLAAGLALALLALVFFVFPANADCCSANDCGHGLSRATWGKLLTFLVLLLPLSAAAMFSPDGFGKTAILNRGILTEATGLRPSSPSPLAAPAPLDLPLPASANSTPAATAVANAPASATAASAPADYLQRTPDGTIIVEVLDLLYAAQDDALRKDFEGKPVQLIGQLMPDTSHNASGKRFKAVRMFMTCCAADARPVATLVQSEKKAAFPEMTWVKIVGTSTFPLENGKRIAVLQADRVEQCAPPDESMLY